MSEFEFLRNVTIGQYLPLNSWLHNRDPRARIIAFTLFILAITFASRITGLLFGLCVLILGLRIGKIPARYVIKGILPFLPMLILIAILQIIFNPYPDTAPILVSIGNWALSPVDFVVVAIILLRFAALIITVSLSSFCLSTFDLTQGLEAMLAPFARFKIPTQDVVLLVQITLRFVPILAQSAERIAKSQASRGARWGTRQGGAIQRIKQFYPLLLPLFLTSLRRAENLALAMDARGYSASNTRTILAELSFQKKDAFLVLVAGISSVLVIIL